MKGSSMDKYDDLQVALNVARDNLKSLNDKIGRDQFRDNRKRQWDKPSFDEGTGKRPRQNVFSRLEPRQQQQKAARAIPGDYNHHEGAVVRPKISSRVTKEVPSREDVVASQSKDEQSRARNKRMFGSLLGTLNKFCQEESRLKPRVEKKAIIEKKVEEQEMRERETSKMERKNLFMDRKKKLMEVRLLEIKMERMQDLAVWEENQKKTREFMRTTAGPKIFWKPKEMNEKTTKLLEESQRQYEEELIKKREAIQLELVEVEERLQKELEKALEDKPPKAEEADEAGDAEQPQHENNRKSSFVDDGAGEEEDQQQPQSDEEEEAEQPRPKLVSKIVKSHVEVSIRNVQAERRHVLQSAVNKKMIISVVNNTYAGGGGGRRF